VKKENEETYLDGLMIGRWQEEEEQLEAKLKAEGRCKMAK